VRRTEAARYLASIDWDNADQQRRLRALMDDVLEFYPETEEESPRSPGRRLRRALERLDAEPAMAVEQDGAVERTTDCAADACAVGEYPNAARNPLRA
jgi:hypothetical protein